MWTEWRLKLLTGQERPSVCAEQLAHLFVGRLREVEVPLADG